MDEVEAAPGAKLDEAAVAGTLDAELPSSSSSLSPEAEEIVAVAAVAEAAAAAAALAASLFGEARLREMPTESQTPWAKVKVATGLLLLTAAAFGLRPYLGNQLGCIVS